VTSAHNVFRIDSGGEHISAPFFDIEDDYFVKSDLWLASAVAIEIMDLFFGVNQGRNVIEFISGFPDHLHRAASDTEALLAELKDSERYKRWHGENP
jgi:hypothetical protein